MARKREGLVPIGEVFGGLDGPVKELREASPQAVHHFTQADQVNQLVEASEADPDPGLHGADDGTVQPAAHQPRQPAPVQARERPLQAGYDRGNRQQAPLRHPAAPVAGLGVHGSSTHPGAGC